MFGPACVPAAPDRFPIVGWAPGLDNLLVATAHYRNGVLLGPLTGRRVSEAIRTGVIASELAPFGLERFQAQVPHMSRSESPQLHLVTDPRLGSRELLGAVEAAAHGGIDWVQVRDHAATAQDLFDLSRRIVSICRPL